MNVVGPDALIGQVVDDRYSVLERIATGGMASVYRAVDTRLDRDVALKVMRPHLAHDEAFVTRFRREARAAARLSHPNIVAVLDHHEDAGRIFLVMEYVPGRNLRDILEDEGPLTPRAALDLMDPVLQALAEAHHGGLIHRDIKPENVIVRDDGVVKVADFGLARAVTSETATSATSEVLGTLSYISPEQVELNNVTTRSDVYAAGLVLFEMLTGRKAFSGESIPNVIFQHLNAGVPTPSTLVPGLPAELDDLVLHAAAKRPEDRPADAGEFLAELRLVRGRLSPEALDRRADGGESTAGTSATAPLPRPGEATDLTAPYAVAGPATAARGGTRGSGAATEAVPVAAAAGAAPKPLRRVAPAPPRAAAANTSAPKSRRRTKPAGPTPPGGPPAAGPAPRRRRRGPLVALIAILVLAAAAVGAYLTIGPGAPTTVPKLATLSVADAHTALARANLKAKDVESFSETVASGIVIAAKPDAGAELRRGQTVTLTVSKGKERYQVPTLANLSRATATSRLAKLNLELGALTTAYSDELPKGRIISSDPAAGTSVKRGTAVAVVVSAGPKPFDVPDFRGEDLEDAEELAEEFGLKLTVAPDPVFSTEYEEDTVASQGPAVGEQVVRGDAVTITMSKGPELIEVPSVFRMSEAEAVAKLEGAGFEVKVEKFLGAPLDMCTGQSPVGGSKAPKGSTVTITIV